MSGRNWFETGGAAYSRFRPRYPPALVRALADASPRWDVAVDVGCGSGQLTRALADRFETVFAFDAAEDPLAHAPDHPRIVYRVGPAETLPLADGTAALVTAAQSAHWFDLDRFATEASRILIPGGLVALIAYGACRVGEDEIQALFARFYGDTLGPYWPPSRALIDDGYRSMTLPFTPVPMPQLEIVDSWDLGQVLGYVGTWSASRRATEAGAEHLLRDFEAELTRAWGPPERTRRISWPLYLRAYTVP